MRRSALALALVAGCGCGHASPEDVSIATQPRGPERLVGGVPHGGPITQLAITEQADAAISIDSLHELRLWPSLDGKHQPLPLQISGATQIVLGHAGDDLLAGIVDQAGSARVMRISRDGTVRGKVQLPGDVAVEQIAAIDNGVIVVRDDQSIERYDASGAPKGRLVAGSGERIGDIAVRRGSAAVLVQVHVEPEAEPAAPSRSRPAAPMPQPPPPPPDIVPVVPPTASEMRWIVIDDGLRWGTSVKLPKPVDARTLALAPNHRRIAVLDAATQTVGVYAVDPLPKPLAVATMLNSTPTAAMGFVDDDHLAVMNGALRWWTAPAMKPAADPWAVESPPPSPFGGARSDVGAIGDGLAVSGFAAALELTSLTVTRYLGWKYIGQGTTTTLDNRLGLAISNTHMLWLDDKLGKVGESDVSEQPDGTPAYTVFVGTHQAVIEVVKDSKYMLSLIDTEKHEKPIPIGTYPYVERIEYDPDVRVLVVGTQGQLLRFQFDPAHGSLSELPALKTNPQVLSVRLLDPAKAGGVTALVVSYEDDGQHLSVYRNDKVDKAKQIHAAKTVAIKGAVLNTDATGGVYVRLDLDPPQLGLMHDGAVHMKYPPELIEDQIIPSHDAQHFIAVKNTDLMLYDAHGKQLWKQSQWATMTVQFTTDDKELLLRTSGGLVMLDAATGTRMAQACGFEFGMFDKDPPVNTLGVTPVCEDLP